MRVTLGDFAEQARGASREGGIMVTAIAFACIQSNGVAVRRVAFTEEFKACLPFLRFSGLGHEPIDTSPIADEGAPGEAVEQHLHVAHAATASIVLPSMAFLRYAPDSGAPDHAVYLRAFGICLHDRGLPANRPAAIPRRDDPGVIGRPLDRLADVVDHLVRDGEYAAADARSPFRFTASADDPLGARATLEGVGDMRVVSARKVRALLLAEPPSYGTTCCLRLYTDTDRPRSMACMRDEKVRVF
jgi:hypothetical protein